MLSKAVIFLLLTLALSQSNAQNDEKIAPEESDIVEETVLTSNNEENNERIESEHSDDDRSEQSDGEKTEQSDGERSEYSDSNERKDGETTTTVMTGDEPTEIDYTVTTDDYKLNDSVLEENETIETTTLPTTRADEEQMLADVEEKEQETSGQRNPKTENSDVPSDLRTFKSHLPPTVSRSSTLRSWLEDTWTRPPAGVLVPLRPMALTRALAVWNDLMTQGLNVTDIVIIGYDSNGVNWRSRHNLQPSNGAKERDVSEALSKLLLKYQGVHTDSSMDGTMRALSTAAKLVPYDSALFVITDKGPGDPQRLPLALRALVDKRLKVYTIWTDPDHPSMESEEALQELRNISRFTEGDVLPYSLKEMYIEHSNLQAELERLGLKQGRRARVHEYHYERYDTLLVRRGGGEAIPLGFSIESGVTALKILIEGAVDHAVLYPPNEAPQIDLFNTSSIAAFSPASRVARLSPRELFLVFPQHTTEDSGVPITPSPSDQHSTMVGVWRLSVRCDSCDYRVTVEAKSNIHLDVETRDLLRLRVNGPVSSVRESVLVDEYGTELAKLTFSYHPIAGEGQDLSDPVTELVADVALPAYKDTRVFVKIVGRDIRGEPFVRLSNPLPHPEGRQSRSTSFVFPEDDLELVEEENLNVFSRLRYNDSNLQPGRSSTQVVNQIGTVLTSVQIGLSTRLYGAPGDNLQLHFEVSNFRQQSVRFSFGAQGEQRFLTGVTPTAQTVLPGQTVNVIVSLRIREAAPAGLRDLITFTAYGIDQVSISAYVYVISPATVTTDSWAPQVWHSFQGTCLGRLGDDCAQHVWSATIVARDNLGGLLRLSSSPTGLIYDSDFISGTREEVTATYRSTCCTPRVMITAVDSYGNVNSYVVDISNYLTDAAIAAIVLGVFLAIAIILLIVYLIYVCVRRRKESRELPYSTSTRNIS